MWKGYQRYDHFFNLEKGFSELNKFLYEAFDDVEQDGNYLNVPASFDIETTSYKDSEGKKYAWMYIWQLGINGSSLIGRTWSDFVKVIKKISTVVESMNSQLVIYVHNLGYEFQFMRKYFNWEKVFSIKERKPLYALTDLSIEFRCSYLLSNYNLAYIGANLLLKYPCQKMIGDLDYSLIRTPDTPLTDKELGYCLNDIRVVMSYIQEKIENEGGISQIPLTNTGYVRQYCRKFCFTNGNKNASQLEKKKALFEYKALMKQLRITSEKEYKQLKEAFGGGFTHANVFYVDQIMKDVGSADLSSSYPFAMVAQKFPMSESIYIGPVNTEEKFNYFLKNFCCLFTVEIWGLQSDLLYENYISISRCIELSDDYISNNGRLVEASHITITVTELDWDIIEKTYIWNEIEIHSMRIYEKSYLPRSLIMSILNLYKNKTSLKGVENMEVEYMVSKNMINSAYGMSVTNIVRDEIEFENQDWHKEEADAASQLNSYNKNFNRFLFYAWGVWVTAHARHNLWEAILEFGDDYVYADTDSIKGINFDKHKDFFEVYNYEVGVQIRDVCRYYKIDYDYYCPKTKKGVEKLIGVWDLEEPYRYFKTLGAKRYIYQHQSGEINMTVSGVNKKFAMPYMFSFFTHTTAKERELLKLAYNPSPSQLKESSEAMEKVIKMIDSGYWDAIKIMNGFTINLYIPRGSTGKQTLTYIDKESIIPITDYKGNQSVVKTLSGIHMEPASYFFSISDEFARYIKGFRDGSF